MAWVRAILIGTIVLLAATVTEPAHAKVDTLTMLELAERSRVAFAGEVTSVEGDTATVVVAEVLSGNLTTGSLSVTPIHIVQCVGKSINFSVGEEVLIFGEKIEAQRVTVAAGGQGKIRLEPKRREMEIAAAKRILAIAPLEEHEKNKAMLAEVRSQNERLRTESPYYITIRISHSKLRGRYKNDLVSLIADTDPAVQRAGLYGIQFIKAADAIPRMIELVHGEDLSVVSAASLALGQYDTDESVAALIGLTKHESPRIRSRACIDLHLTMRPEAKNAQVQLLDDEDSGVRAVSPTGLVRWLRRNEADDVLPRLVDMLNDPDSEVRVSAAYALGECRRSELVPPLLAAFKNESQDEKVKRSLLRALYCHYSKGDARAKELIDKDIQLIIATLRSGGPSDCYGPSQPAVGILGLSSKTEAKDALQWAAQSHPSKEIRAYAKRCLSR